MKIAWNYASIRVYLCLSGLYFFLIFGSSRGNYIEFSSVRVGKILLQCLCLKRPKHLSTISHKSDKHFAFHHYIFYIPSAIILYDIWCENLTLISESGISHRRRRRFFFFGFLFSCDVVKTKKKSKGLLLKSFFFF